MERLTPVSHRELIRRLRKLGFQGPYPGTKHPFFIKNGRPYHVPNPHGHEISVSLLRRVLAQLEVTRAEWDSAG
ncbi:MAG: type II toxin-antitoxin system HicA family toxin [Planctomycetes bacterium]|nr:type II toxin-antitoxin system HicA family toxin [Planctomycetota bacterium]